MTNIISCVFKANEMTKLLKLPEKTPSQKYRWLYWTVGTAAAAIFAFFLIKHFCWNKKLSPKLAEVTKVASSQVAIDAGENIAPTIENELTIDLMTDVAGEMSGEEAVSEMGKELAMAAQKKTSEVTTGLAIEGSLTAAEKIIPKVEIAGQKGDVSNRGC